MQAARAAMNQTFDRDTVFIRNGGSIPIVAEFQQRLGLDSVLMGFGLESDAIHSPNEKFGLNRYAKGIETIIHYYPELAKRLV
jgi:acetylornithine deacetylase/succinyl-diaminopimelate desuccinylase-like protein